MHDLFERFRRDGGGGGETETIGRNSAVVCRGMRSKAVVGMFFLLGRSFGPDQSRFLNGCRHTFPLLWLSRLSLRLPDRARRSQATARGAVESRVCSVRTNVLCASSLFVLTVAFSLGQDPPPQQQEESFDGRSLAEVCVSHIS